jgi:hypothetical protein
MKKPNRRECLHYIIGADLGQAMEPTAFAVVEQRVVGLRPRGKGRAVSSMKLRHLERLPLNVTYPQIITRLEELVEAVKDDEGDRRRWGTEPSSDVVVNITGTGRAIGEAMEEAKLHPIFVTVSAGAGEHKDSETEWRIARNELIGGLQYLFQNDRFEVAGSMALADKFVEELEAESWRDRPDEDLVFATALAAWRGRRYLPKSPAMRESERRRMEASSKEMDASHRMRIGLRGPRIAEVREDGAVLRRTWNR